MSRGLGSLQRRALDIVYLLGPDRELHQATLRHDLEIGTAAMARLLANLEERRLIERRERPLTVRLTPKGRRAVERHHRERLRPRRLALTTSRLIKPTVSASADVERPLSEVSR